MAIIPKPPKINIADLESAFNDLGASMGEAGAAMKKLANAFHKVFKDEKKVFELNSPQVLTIKNRKDEYRKRPFIGEEKFTPASAYIGAKGDLIFVFQPTVPSDFKFVEMYEKDACEHLIGFREYNSSILSRVYDREVESVHGELKKLADEERMKAEASRYKDSRYGSW